MKPTLLFVHGMFLTAKSWEHWIEFFDQRGYRCKAPNWPLHDGEPALLRTEVPPGTGRLDLDTLVDAMARAAAAEARPPIVIGHSLGGLIAQLLAARGLVEAAVAICPVAPNGLLATDWGFLRNSAQIANPLRGDDPFIITPEGFHRTFTNMMSREQSDEMFARYAVHESRNVLRDAMGPSGCVDVRSPHVPLLFIGAEADEIIPPKLVRKNADSYESRSSVREYREFPGRGHFIAGEPGWEDVAHYVHEWLERHAVGEAASVSASGAAGRSLSHPVD